MTRRLLIFPALFLCISLCPLTLPKLSASPQEAPQDTAAIERGRKQFQQSCGFCHGADATGARGPDLVRSPLVAHDVKGNLIGEVVHQGRPDKGMPPMTLTDAQISDVVAFLHERGADALRSAEVPKVYPVEKLLTGNADAGKAYFQGKGGCANCHSATGDLAGIARKFSPIELQAHMLYPDGKKTSAVVTLPTGEQVKGVVVHADEFQIGLRDSSGWYRSFRREQVKVEITDPLAAHRDLLDKITQAEVHDLFAYLQTLK